MGGGENMNVNFAFAYYTITKIEDQNESVFRDNVIYIQYLAARPDSYFIGWD